MALEINPNDLITPYRFDLMIKYLYGKSILREYDTSVFKKFYYDHIEKWNGFNEPNNSSKNSFQAFDETFRNLLHDFKNNQFDTSKELIPVMSWFQGFSILNGAHRTAAALLTNNNILCQEIKKLDYSKECFNASWLDRFSRHDLDRTMTDLAAIQYAKLKSSTHIAILFPSSREHHSQMIEDLNYKFRGKVVYAKEIRLSENGKLNLMNEFYHGESWTGNAENDYSGLRYKARKCFTNDYPSVVCLLDYESLEEVVKAKQSVRELSNLQNHSIHISDTHQQSIELSRLFFNDNSLTWLNYSKFNNFYFFERLLGKFKHEILENNYDIDEYCITASSVLSAFGLRQGDDLDYIKTNNSMTLHSHGHQINCHNSYGLLKKIYPDAYDELIMNPQHHFYYKGVKFLSIDNLQYLKTTRGETKDFNDHKLISSLFEDIV